VKVLFVVFGKPGLSHEQCLVEWRSERHTAIVKRVPGLLKWVQNHAARVASASTPDGVGELWFESAEAVDRAMRSSEMAAAVEDAKTFLDMEKTFALVAEEVSIVG
jgi:uncharacterized protein (TIGR02118 family)